MKPASVWFCVPATGALLMVPRAQIRWALSFDGSVGPFASVELAEAQMDDRRRVCSRCGRGRGRHVCATCQAAILPATLSASVATGGAR